MGLRPLVPIGKTDNVEGSSWYPQNEVSSMFELLHSEGDEETPRLPYGDIALPLGGHLALSVREKIWSGEYVDMFSLLHTEPEPVPKVREPVRDKEVMRKGKIVRNWTNWLYSYAIYMAIVVQMYPKKCRSPYY